MDYTEFLKEDRRLVILRLLSEMPSYRSNTSILCAGLDQMGHAATRDQVKTDVEWLAEQSLVKTEDVGSVVVVQLLERGQDVATGRAVVPGVKKPGA